MNLLLLFEVVLYMQGDFNVTSVAGHPKPTLIKPNTSSVLSEQHVCSLQDS